MMSQSCASSSQKPKCANLAQAGSKAYGTVGNRPINLSVQLNWNELSVHAENGMSINQTFWTIAWHPPNAGIVGRSVRRLAALRVSVFVFRPLSLPLRKLIHPHTQTHVARADGASGEVQAICYILTFHGSILKFIPQESFLGYRFFFARFWLVKVP